VGPAASVDGGGKPVEDQIGGNMKNTLLGWLGFLGAVVTASSQEPPQIFWQVDAAARNVTFAPDGLTMYTGGIEVLYPYAYGNIKKWDVPGRTMIYSVTHGGSGRIGLTNDVAVSPDGAAIASAHGSVYCIPHGPCINIAGGFGVWDAGTAALRFELGAGDVDGLGKATSFSHDGRFVALGLSRTPDDEIRVYNLPEFTLRDTYPGHELGTFCLAFSPVENLLATGGWDGLVRLWDVESSQLVRQLVHGDYIHGGYPVSVCFSPDGSRLAVSGDGYDLKVTVWDVHTGELVHELVADQGANGARASVAIAPNGRYVAAGITRLAGLAWEGAIRFWDLTDGTLAREYVEDPISGGGTPLVSMAISPAADNWYAYTYDDRIHFAETDLELGFAPAGVAGSGTLESTGHLLMASPNPFPRATSLRYAVPRDGHVRIAIYDVAGREIVNLVNEHQVAGSYSVDLDAQRLPRRPLSAGTYFCRMQAPGITGTRRLLLTR